LHQVQDIYSRLINYDKEELIETAIRKFNEQITIKRHRQLSKKKLFGKKFFLNYYYGLSELVDGMFIIIATEMSLRS
jgi:hypothetical protein